MGNPLASDLDIRTMRTLLILLTECSVTGTAEILGVTQPTVSLALSRLRKMLGDPLLVRSGSRLVPTARGIELRPQLKRILGDIDQHLSITTPFDPPRSTRQFRLVSANCLGTIFIPRIAKRLRAESPLATLEVRPMLKEEELIRQLASGDLDLVFGSWPRPPEDLRMSPLLTTDIVCLVGAQHPLARTARLTMEQYLGLHHLSPSAGQCSAMGAIGGRLLELGLSRRIAMSVPDHGSAAYVLAQTDLVFTTGRPFAEHLASLMPLSVIEAPPELGAINLYMLWHDRNHRSPEHRWLRDIVRAIAGEFKSIEPVVNEGVETRRTEQVSMV